MKKHTILFLHGALGTSHELKPLMEIMKGDGHDVLSFDFSGHGKKGKWPDEFRIDLFARDLESYLKTHQCSEIKVFGHSMGGFVALYYQAFFENSPIEQIFTYGTKFNWEADAVKKEILHLNPDHLAEKFPDHATALKERHGERWKVLLQATAHMIEHLEKLDGLTKEDLSDIKIPVTLMLGDQDRTVTSEETQLTKDWLQNGAMKTISHSKHDLERSNLKEIAQVIIGALD
jgi:esterase/lipase